MIKRPSASDLALRDPATAALMGIVGGEAGDSGTTFGADFGADFGDDYGDDAGADFGADAPPPPPPPAALQHPATAAHYHRQVQAWHGRQQHVAHRRGMPEQVAHTMHPRDRARHEHHARRALMLDPNNGAEVKVERYTFAMNVILSIGTASAFNITQNPDTTIRPQRVTMNAPMSGFVIINEIKVANVSVTVGGSLDAYQFNPNAVGSSLDMPTLGPQNRVGVLGSYSSAIPTYLLFGNSFTFVMSFTGPSSLAG